MERCTPSVFERQRPLQQNQPSKKLRVPRFGGNAEKTKTTSTTPVSLVGRFRGDWWKTSHRHSQTDWLSRQHHTICSWYKRCSF